VPNEELDSLREEFYAEATYEENLKFWADALAESLVKARQELRECTFASDRLRLAEECLSGQALALFRALSRRKGKVAFEELSQTPGIFLVQYPSDRTIKKAVERLNKNLLNLGFVAEISDRRVELIDLQPATNNTTSRVSSLARRLRDNTHQSNAEERHDDK